ncbi:MAG TPA: HlyD family efflux transporter periplasmic adaptor subunit [Hydrogenophaga sp.]
MKNVEMHFPKHGFGESIAPPKKASLALKSIVISLSLLVLWAALAKIDQVTRASAQFIAAERNQLVQSADAGVITEIHVREGDQVKKGQMLVTLEKARAEAAVDDTKSKVAALRATIVRQEAELFRRPLRFDAELQRYPEFITNQTQLFMRRQKAFQEEVGSLERILKIAEEELSINARLVPTGDVSKAEVLRLNKGVADIRAQISNRRNKYFQETQAEMTKAREELATYQEQLRDRSQLLEHTELVAPTDGVVNNIRATTLGAVLRQGDVVMEIFPTGGDLIAEAKISPVDIAFVQVGQESVVKVDAFDSTIFGSLRGRVSYISPDVLKEEAKEGTRSFYRVHVLIKSAEFQGKKAGEIQLRPGMTAQVNIKARERTVLSYLTKPIAKTLGESLGER